MQPIQSKSAPKATENSPKQQNFDTCTIVPKHMNSMLPLSSRRKKIIDCSQTCTPLVISPENIKSCPNKSKNKLRQCRTRSTSTNLTPAELGKIMNIKLATAFAFKKN